MAPKSFLLQIFRRHPKPAGRPTPTAAPDYPRPGPDGSTCRNLTTKLVPPNGAQWFRRVVKEPGGCPVKQVLYRGGSFETRGIWQRYFIYHYFIFFSTKYNFYSTISISTILYFYSTIYFPTIFFFPVIVQYLQQ